MMVVRLLLLGAGIIAFTLAVRTDNELARWLSIGLVATALVLRFVKRPPGKM